jgi:hypothetical protein
MLARVRSAVVGVTRSSTDDVDEEQEGGDPATSTVAAQQQHRVGMVVDMADNHFIGALLPCTVFAIASANT